MNGRMAYKLSLATGAGCTNIAVYSTVTTGRRKNAARKEAG
jgi:hypothetical protein